jgi:hypothetical protein
MRFELTTEAISLDALPKIALIQGSVHIEWKRCGRPNCRCERGFLHGPYYYRRLRAQGRQIKRYVKRDAVVGQLLATQVRREADRQIAELRRMTAVLAKEL